MKNREPAYVGCGHVRGSGFCSACDTAYLDAVLAGPLAAEEVG